MKFKLKKIRKFCGEKASFYAVITDEKGNLFGNFLEENSEKFQPELTRMLIRMQNMANVNGATDNFFKLNESSNPNDTKVVAYYDEPDKNLRVYCVKMSDELVVLGGGGPKPKWIIKWQQNKKLKQEAELIMQVSEMIDLKMELGELHISFDGLSFIGNLELN